MLFPPEAAQAASPSLPSEVKDAASQEVPAPPSQRLSSKPAAAVTHTDTAVEAMNIDITKDPGTDSDQAAQRLASQAGAASVSEAASAMSDHDTDANSTVMQKKQGKAKPRYIAKGLRLVRRSAVPKAYAFADAARVKAALSNAWSSDSDVGKQLAALYELFGDSILPYVPMLPYLSSSI